MTGHQDHAATGKTLQGEPTYAINIYKLCKAIGIDSVHEINAFDIDGLKKGISFRSVPLFVLQVRAHRLEPSIHRVTTDGMN